MDFQLTVVVVSVVTQERMLAFFWRSENTQQKGSKVISMSDSWIDKNATPCHESTAPTTPLGVYYSTRWMFESFLVFRG